MAEKEPIIGIDLGTTNSEVAFLENGSPRVLKLHDDGIVPSCVALDPKGNILVGREARNQILVNPRATVCSIKRKMGTNEKVRMGKEHYTPQEISAFILKTLKRRAESVLGRSISKAVITVPAYFTDAQRHATREAGEIAGLDVVRIINEPTAAALAYGAGKEESQRILVYDLGGGTFDVSIVTIESGVVEVMASTGNNHLGGDDFDAKIVERLLEVLESEHEMKDFSDPVLKARLKRAAEKAKIQLSDNPFALIAEDHVGHVRGRPVHLEYELSRLEFEEMIRDDIMETMEAVAKALRDASALPGSLDKILLVGGSTRIPLVSRFLEDKLRKLPHSEVDPDLCVALGASIQGGMEMGKGVGSVLVDVTPYTFGTSSVEGYFGDSNLFVPLIRRNTKLPATKSEVFFTVVDGQKAVDIDVYQGEDPDVRNNVLVGNFLFDGLSNVPEGNEIVLTFGLDVNGLLKVHGLEKRTGRDISGVVENAMRSFDGAEIELSRQRLAEVWTDDVDNGDGGGEEGGEEEEWPEGVRAEDDGDETAVVMRTVDSAREAMEKASEEDREDMAELVGKIKEALDEGDLAAAMELAEELDDILFYLE
jgi:molecular chaperone DnaK (HSP70)